MRDHAKVQHAKLCDVQVERAIRADHVLGARNADMLYRCDDAMMITAPFVRDAETISLKGHSDRGSRADAVDKHRLCGLVLEPRRRRDFYAKESHDHAGSAAALSRSLSLVLEIGWAPA